MPEEDHQKTASKQIADPSTDNSFAIVSMALGVTSLVGPGLVLGIPAIVLASIALKRNQGERGLSIAGLVTGIISTILSLLFIMGLILLMIWGATLPETDRGPYNTVMEQKI